MSSVIRGDDNIDSADLESGRAKAWAVFDASSGTPSITTAFNVSSIADLGVGIYEVNFSTPLPSADYAWSIGTQDQTNNTTVVLAQQGRGNTTVDKIPVFCTYNNISGMDNYLDWGPISVIVF